MLRVKTTVCYLIISGFFLLAENLFCQSYTSRDNYTGSWSDPASWTPDWPVPLSNVTSTSITINGFITSDSSLSFSGGVSILTVKDTLIIHGSLTLDNNNDLIVENGGILIVHGNLKFGNQTELITNGYLIITGDLVKQSSVLQGSFTSNDNPVKIFIGGALTLPAITLDAPGYTALSCVTPITVPYVNTNCSYGNMADLAQDPIFAFFQNLCSHINKREYHDFCIGDTIRLLSSPASVYLWSGPSGFTSTLRNPVIYDAEVNRSGDYLISITLSSGCTDKDTVTLTARDKPVPSPGADQTLSLSYQTKMDATLQPMETGIWTLISGAGVLEDALSPTTVITGLGEGENIFMWMVSNNWCTDSDLVSILVKGGFIPSVITPNGDGRNDYLRLPFYDGIIGLTIFDQWGMVVFKNDDYENNWYGTDKNGDSLPEGSYFYILAYCNGLIKKGTIFIKR